MKRSFGVGTVMLLVLIMFMTPAVSAAAENHTPAEDHPATDEYRIPDPGNGGTHFQVMASSDGSRVYNAGFWGWGHGGLGKFDLTVIHDDHMGDVYGADMMMGIMIPYYVMPVPAIGFVAGYNVDRKRPFLAVYPEISIRVMLGRRADLGLMGRYYISSEGTDENLLFFGAGFDWAFSKW